MKKISNNLYLKLKKENEIKNKFLKLLKKNVRINILEKFIEAISNDLLKLKKENDNTIQTIEKIKMV